MPKSSPPLQIAGYHIMPIALPSLPSYPTAATHYLYLAPHQPKIPIPTASRSLFLVNVPLDSTEIHLKHLLSAQIELPVGRIEEVQFEGQRKSSTVATEASANERPMKKGKKRKRGSEGGAIDNIEEAALPPVWDRELQTNGLTAVVIFVDRASMDAALKAVKALRKDKREPVWVEGLDSKVPKLGSESKICVFPCFLHF